MQFYNDHSFVISIVILWNWLGGWQDDGKPHGTKVDLFPSMKYVLFFQPPFPLSQTVEWQNNSTAWVDNELDACWRPGPLNAALPAKGVWVNCSQLDNQSHCCVCLDSTSKFDPPTLTVLTAQLAPNLYRSQEKSARCKITKTNAFSSHLISTCLHPVVYIFFLGLWTL